MQKLEDIIAIPADPSDPEDFDVGEAELRRALIDRDRRVRGMQLAPTKKQISLRLDPEVIDKFRATGKGWQARMNAVLKAARV